MKFGKNVYGITCTCRSDINLTLKFNLWTLHTLIYRQSFWRNRSKNGIGGEKLKSKNGLYSGSRNSDGQMQRAKLLKIMYYYVCVNICTYLLAQTSILFNMS